MNDDWIYWKKMYDESHKINQDLIKQNKMLNRLIKKLQSKGSKNE